MHANGFEVGIWVHGLEGDLKKRTRPFATHYAQWVCSPVQTACLSPEGGETQKAHLNAMEVYLLLVSGARCRQDGMG